MTDDRPPNPMPIADAIELYCESRRELAESTRRSHRHRLTHLIRWADQHDDVSDTGDLTGHRLHDYRLWRRDDGDLSVVSVHTQLSTLRVFCEFLETVDAVRDGLHEKVQPPSLNGEDERTRSLDADRANDILQYLARYEYASLDHVAIRLLWRTGMRVGELRALDVEDYQRRQRQLTVRHRPQGGTPLKNKSNGERNISLVERTCTVLDDWIDDRRPDETDVNGREPLLTTGNGHGRVAKGTVRRRCYRWTQPCQIGRDCPHGTTPDECSVAGHTDSIQGCPSIRSPHDLRRGSISFFLSEDVPPAAIRGRANVSDGVLSKHYDIRSEEGKAEQRRRYFE